MNQQPDIIFIEGLSVDASIGVYDWEKQIKQKLIFDVELSSDIQQAGQSDQLDDTVCYAAVSEHITQLTQHQHIDLLEALAEQICSSVLANFNVSAIKLRISKPGAVPTAKNVGIQIVRNRLSQSS